MKNEKMRPYLVIPKLIEQPTWGGTYIVETKKWGTQPSLSGKKIGQSYELYDKSNLSLLTDSSDPQFTGELTDPKAVTQQSTIPGAVPLSLMIDENPEGVLGAKNVGTFGNVMHLLLKFTQALGNSFQLHVPDGLKNAKWKPKPESWYYFEPGLITCGVKKDASWDAYKTAVSELDRGTNEIAAKVKDGSVSYEDAKSKIAELIKRYDPWQFVNVVRVEKGTLLDLSPCGIHHSWEEDLATIPLGNVLYEIQLNVMDDVATIRSFDKGKMAKDGTLRPLQIDDYFAFADRSPEANDPNTHMRKATTITETADLTHKRLLATKYYAMDDVSMSHDGAAYTESIDTFRHIYVQSGVVDVNANGLTVTASTGHSVFVPAGCGSYTVSAKGNSANVLISY